MDIQDQYVDIQLCDKNFTYSVLISIKFIIQLQYLRYSY